MSPARGGIDLMQINRSILVRGSYASIGDYVALTKPRVMSLVVFTALVGLMVAPGGIDPFAGVVALLCIAAGAGAAAALNMWYDADIDALMARTACVQFRAAVYRARKHWFSDCCLARAPF
jgi:protoheme IX farnesyltransferase